MKILVSGGTGVVGAAAIPALLAAGHHVRLLSRHANHDRGEFPNGVEAFETDIGDASQLMSAAQGCDAVLHIAGIVEESPPEITFQKVNIEGTANLLTAAQAAGAPPFIHLSSLGADRGQSEYHQSKRRAEELVRDYPGDWVILRPGNVYGPGDETVSLLLKMVRTLPAVPMVDDGGQRFQPIWFADLGRAIVHVVDDISAFSGETFELAGTDITTTAELLKRFSEITGRSPASIAVPAWLAEMGAKALEAFGASGHELLQRAGLATPINSSKLNMLLEGNVLTDPERNALLLEFGVEPTRLEDGLHMLADLLPEQLPGDGVGAIKYAIYWADIHGTSLSAKQLLDQVCDHITEVMPMEFAAEPGAPTRAGEGATLTAEIKGRGNVQVRLNERTPGTATFVTLESHPLAGVMQLAAEERAEVLRFAVHTASQPANAFDWLAMKTIGETLQQVNWRSVVSRVVKLSGGTAPEGVHRKTDTLDEGETHELRRWIDQIVQRQHRRRAEAGLTALKAHTR